MDKPEDRDLLEKVTMPNAFLDTYIEYYDLVKAKCDLIDNGFSSADLACKLNHNGPTINTDNFALAMLGSDSRLESCVFSNRPYELGIFYHSRPTDFDETLNRLRKVYDNEQEAYLFREFPLTNVDLTKVPDSAMRSPTLVLDAFYLIGSKQIFIDFINILNTQIKDPRIGKSILTSVKDDFNESVDCFTGIQARTRLEHFNPLEGFSYIDRLDPEKPRKLRRESFKQGPLRAVQFYLAKEIIKAIRTNTKLTPDFLLNLPQDLERRAKYLETLKVTPNLDQVMDHYKYFLHQYHRALHNLDVNEKTRTRVFPNIVPERLNDLRKRLV